MHEGENQVMTCRQ